MYIFNGFVYGESPQDIIKVKSVKPLDDMIMLITFSNNETRLFDATILNGTVFEPLRNEEVFQHPQIEYGVVTWDNGNIDCAPEYLYEHSYEYEPMTV